MTSCHGELLQVMRRPSEQMAAQVVVEGLRLRATKMGHESQHEADMVLGSLIVSCPRDAVLAHPRAQRKRRLSEHDALAIGISSSAKAGFKRVLRHDPSAENIELIMLDGRPPARIAKSTASQLTADDERTDRAAGAASKATSS